MKTSLFTFDVLDRLLTVYHRRTSCLCSAPALCVTLTIVIRSSRQFCRHCGLLCCWWVMTTAFTTSSS